jgi:hypothetical protein
VIPTSDANPWVLLIVSVGTSTTIGGIVNAYLSRRKTRAEVGESVARTGKTSAEITDVGANTANTQVDTSLKLMLEMRTEMTMMREGLLEARREAADARIEARKMRRELDDATEQLAAAVDEVAGLQRWKQSHTQLTAAHASWDVQVVQVVRELGGRIDAPPPLTAHI